MAKPPKAPREKPDYKRGSISQPGTPKRPREAPAKGEVRGAASDCIDEIERYEKQFEQWAARTKQIVRRYRDQRDPAQTSARSFNILWSNVQILKPTLYAHAPKAEVVRRFKDQDPVGRCGCEIAERATDVEIEAAKVDEAMRDVVIDRLLGGRGQAWISYDPTITGRDAEKDEPGEKTDDGLCVDYVDWRDFGHSPLPTWELVCKNGKVWRWKPFSREEFSEQFGDEYIDQVEFTERKDNDKREADGDPVARIAEVWDIETRRVYWVSKGVPEYLDEYADPLHLESFFPCPKPCFATLTPNSLVPVPDFYLYQDQADEVDKLTGRINRLTNALKIVGVYDQSVKELEDVMDPRGVRDNTLVPVNMDDLTGKGGLRQAVQLVDISYVVATLQACYTAREQAINAIYQTTGIADVLRGATDPNETLGAQQLKAQFGGTRIRDMQQDVARFSRDLIRIMAEIIVEMYSPMKLWEMTNAVSFVGTAPQPPPMPGQPSAPPQPNVQLFAQALKMLKSDKLRSYRVDIETDSTIALDEAQSKQEAVEFVGTIGGMLEKAVPMATQIPATIPFLKESLLFVARRFKAGRGMEMAIETMGDQLGQQAQQPKPPSPEVIKAQAAQAKSQADMQKMQMQMKLAEVKTQLAAAEGQQKLQLEQQRAQLESELLVWESQHALAADAQLHQQHMMQSAQDHAQSMIQQSEAARLKAETMRQTQRMN